MSNSHVMRTQLIGRQFIELASVPSTNNYAADHLALSELQHGAVVLAHEQTAGRGQRERSWISAPELDLTFSIVLIPRGLKVSEQFVLARIAALSVLEVVRELQPAEVRVKWPNDVLVGRRKIAGILIKNDVVAGLVTSAIVGIGLNVNNPELGADLNATSLRLVTGGRHDRMDLLDRICERFEGRWLAWDEGHDASEEEFNAQLWSRGRWADLELDGTPVKGRPLSVKADGRLMVEWENGEVGDFGTERLRFGPRS